MPFRLHLRVRRVDGDAAVTLRLVRWRDVETRLVDVDPDEVEWRCDRLQFVIGEFRRILTGPLQVLVGVPTLEHDRSEEHTSELQSLPTRRASDLSDCIFGCDALMGMLR